MERSSRARSVCVDISEAWCRRPTLLESLMSMPLCRRCAVPYARMRSFFTKAAIPSCVFRRLRPSRSWFRAAWRRARISRTRRLRLSACVRAVDVSRCGVTACPAVAGRESLSSSEEAVSSADPVLALSFSCCRRSRSRVYLIWLRRRRRWLSAAFSGTAFAAFFMVPYMYSRRFSPFLVGRGR